MANKLKDNLFDQSTRVNNVDYKLIVAIEKISEAFRAILWDVAKKNELTPTQVQILLYIKYKPLQERKIIHLSKAYDLTKATISDAVSTLEQKNFLTKTKDVKDARSTLLSLTPEGELKVKSVEHFADIFLPTLKQYTSRAKGNTLNFLSHILAELTNNNTIEPKNLCFTCDWYKGNLTQQHYCEKAQSEMKNKMLRLDCPDHKVN